MSTLLGLIYVVAFAISFISSIAAMIVAGIIAGKNRRSVVGWVFCAFAIGWVAVIIVAVTSRRKKPDTSAYIRVE